MKLFRLVLIALCVTGMAAAHEMLGIVGTVKKVQNGKFTMDTSDGEKNVTVETNKDTEVTLLGRKATLSALKAGQSVVISAYGDDYEGSLALSIRIVPKIKTPPTAKK